MPLQEAADLPCGGPHARTARHRFLRAAIALAHARAAELVAALAAVVLYLPSMGYGFVFDDTALIAPDGSPLALGGAVPYRPLRYASYLVDRWLGATPAIYHAHNVLLHALVAALVVALARRLGSGRVAALAAGLLVACHPIAVEAVAYVAGRRDLLCVAFGLGAVLAHASGRLGVALSMLLLSIASKESGLVFVAPLAALTLAGLDGAMRGRPRHHAAAGIAAAGVAGLALALSYGAIGPWMPALDVSGLALPGRVAAHYVAGLAGLRALAPEYPQLVEYVARVRAADAPAALAGVLVSLAMAAAGAASLLACRRAGTRGRGAQAAFVLAWFIAALVAVAVWGGLHEPGVDRHAYLLLPPLGVALALSMSRARVPGLTTLARAAVAGGVIVLIATSAAASRRQMQVWQSERTLWGLAVSAPSASPRAHANFARILAGDGDYAGALQHMKAALAGNPDDPLLYLGRAAMRCAHGRRGLARRDLARAHERGAQSRLVGELARECLLPSPGGEPEPAS